MSDAAQALVLLMAVGVIAFIGISIGMVISKRADRAITRYEEGPSDDDRPDA